MLNHDSLAQLQGLKSQMEAEKEHADAIIKGTQARYGFAVLEDGREIFIPPDERPFPKTGSGFASDPPKTTRPLPIL